MRFARELSAVGGKWGLAILGVLTTILGVVAYLLSKSIPLTLALVFGFLFLATLGATYEFWTQRNDANDKVKKIEETPEFKIDATLKQALELQENLTYKAAAITPQEQRRLVGALIFQTHSVVADYAPAYVDDLKTESIDGSGPEQLLGVVTEYYRVLAAVRKQL
jgi:hypothetical protein